jgi:hypothetical protein
MYMGPIKLILFRIYNLTLGRFTSKLLKKQLTKKLIEEKEEKYTASSKFFAKEELRED